MAYQKVIRRDRISLELSGEDIDVSIY